VDFTGLGDFRDRDLEFSGRESRDFGGVRLFLGLLLLLLNSREFRLSPFSNSFSSLAGDCLFGEIFLSILILGGLGVLPFFKALFKADFGLGSGLFDFLEFLRGLFDFLESLRGLNGDGDLLEFCRLATGDRLRLLLSSFLILLKIGGGLKSRFRLESRVESRLKSRESRVASLFEFRSRELPRAESRVEFLAESRVEFLAESRVEFLAESRTESRTDSRFGESSRFLAGD